MKEIRNNKIKLDSGRKGFRIAYDNLPCKSQRIIRSKLMNSLKWSRVTFYNKLNGDTPIWEKEIQTITDIFKENGFDAWTGQTLFFK